MNCLDLDELPLKSTNTTNKIRYWTEDFSTTSIYYCKTANVVFCVEIHYWIKKQDLIKIIWTEIWLETTLIVHMKTSETGQLN